MALAAMEDAAVTMMLPSVMVAAASDARAVFINRIIFLSPRRNAGMHASMERPLKPTPMTKKMKRASKALLRSLILSWMESGQSMSARLMSRGPIESS